MSRIIGDEITMSLLGKFLVLINAENGLAQRGYCKNHYKEVTRQLLTVDVPSNVDCQHYDGASTQYRETDPPSFYTPICGCHRYPVSTFFARLATAKSDSDATVTLMVWCSLANFGGAIPSPIISPYDTLARRRYGVGWDDEKSR